MTADEERRAIWLEAELTAAREEVARLTHELVDAQATRDEGGPVRCATHDTHAQGLLHRALERLGTELPCKHKLGDLVAAPGTITQCGACIALRQKKRALGPDGGK